MDFLAKDFFETFQHVPDGGDIIDELSYHYTSIILFAIGVAHMGMLYVARPIQCWIPPEFPDQWEKYTENICFFGKNTYYFPDDECEKAGIDDEFCMRKHGDDGQIAYYQWVPILLIVQAFAFAAPSYFWRSFQDLTSNTSVSMLH